MIFRQEFMNMITKVDWTYKGILKHDGTYAIMPPGAMFISQWFEAVIHEHLDAMAETLNMKVLKAPYNWYPDYSLLSKDGLYAIDVKSTYRKPTPHRLTLGTFKNLQTDGGTTLFPYSEYDEHWIVPFLYTRVWGERCPFKDVEVKAVEKWRIAHTTMNGNVDNIYSIPFKDLNDLMREGEFKSDAYMVHYWKNYVRDYTKKGGRKRELS